MRLLRVSSFSQQSPLRNNVYSLSYPSFPLMPPSFRGDGRSRKRRLVIAAVVLFFGETSLAKKSSWTTPRPSARAEKVESFKVMDVVARASELEREGRRILHLEVGQPETGAPAAVRAAAAAAVDKHRIGYTAALGIPELREKISKHYKDRYGVHVPPGRVVVTTGSSGAFLLAFLAAFDAGDRVAVASSSYPCYRHILNALGCKVATIACNSEYKVTAVELRAELRASLEGADDSADEVEAAPLIKGIVLSSPSNPTGALMRPEEVADLARTCAEHGVLFVSDEIYHGLTYGDQEADTALRYSDQAIVINSFSKYYSMTGWRLGWMVVPESLLDAVNRLAQNVYINAPTLSQVAAAAAAFDCADELEAHRLKYARNRAVLLDGLRSLGVSDMAPSDGAFYVYADLGGLVADSREFARDLLEEAGVAVTPGEDFEAPESGGGGGGGGGATGAAGRE